MKNALTKKTFFGNAPRFWERRGPLSLLLWPLSFLFGLILRVRKNIQDLGWPRQKPQSIPIIIVGNIRVGGTGKTPIVIALAERLSQQGWKPGIISRGYGAANLTHPQQVQSHSDPRLAGDEPVLMAQLTRDRFPIWVFPKRVQSIKAMLRHDPSVNVIISDDGLQHSGLFRWPAREGGRDIELVVRDQRGEGNGFLLPAGPLREPANRDRDASIMMKNECKQNPESLCADEYFLGRRAFTLYPELGHPYQLHQRSFTLSFEQITQTFKAHEVTAVAAIGNPQRFFEDLRQHGLSVKGIALPDHASYTPEFFAAINAQCILITEKDAVKCTLIEDPRIWVVPMNLRIPDTFADWLQSILLRPDPNRYTL